MSPIRWLTTATNDSLAWQKRKQTSARKLNVRKYVYQHRVIISAIQFEAHLFMLSSTAKFFWKTLIFKKSLNFKHWKSVCFHYMSIRKEVYFSHFLQIFRKIITIMWMEFITVQNIRHGVCLRFWHVRETCCCCHMIGDIHVDCTQNREWNSLIPWKRFYQNW